MNQDGHAHFAYYDPERCISYVWAGGSMIEVCPGGYGEPMAAQIRASRAMMAARTPGSALHEFAFHVKSKANPLNAIKEGTL